MGGMASGAINGAGFTALAGGSFSDVMAGMTQGAVMGSFAGAAAGGVGAWIGNFSGVTGSGFKNAIYEIGHSAVKGGAQGLAGGAMMAAMNQDASYLWRGAAFGAGFATGMAVTRIGIMGSLYIPDEDYYGKLEDYGQVYRRGGITPKGSGYVWKNNIVYKALGKQTLDQSMMRHEIGHMRDIASMGWNRFLFRTIKEYGKYGYDWGWKTWNSHYHTGTLEYRADQYVIDQGYHNPFSLYH